MFKRTGLWILAVLALVAASCGGSSSGGEASAGGGIDPDKPVIKIVANAWTASALDAEIAKQLIEAHLGNEVEVVDIDENTMFSGLADGSLDAVLEIWPSGLVAEEQAYFDDGSVENLGELGAVGRIGWFVPQYVIDDNPALATWEGYTDPEVAKTFATAETGDQGRFLGTDPSYSQYDEPIIENLGLPFVEVFSGSEAATVAEVDSRTAAKEPILLYWWTPTAAVGKYDLVKVELPPYTDGCYDDPAAIACDYPEDKLMKAGSPALAEKDADVHAFLKAFTLSNDDQLGMLPSVEIDKEEVSAVAAKWIADNESVWSAWLPA